MLMATEIYFVCFRTKNMRKGMRRFCASLKVNVFGNIKWVLNVVFFALLGGAR